MFSIISGAKELEQEQNVLTYFVIGSGARLAMFSDGLASLLVLPGSADSKPWESTTACCALGLFAGPLSASLRSITEGSAWTFLISRSNGRATSSLILQPVEY